MEHPVLTIRELRVRAVRVPMAEPHRTASGTIVESPLVLVDVLTDQGVVGHSYIFCYAAFALAPTARLVKDLGPLIAGQPVTPLVIAELLGRKFRLLGRQGLAGMAIAAIDMALWDVLARAHEVSLLRLLGAEPRPIAAYGAIGYDGAAGSAKVAADWARRGFRGVKAKIGYPTLREDVEVVRAIRSEVGDAMSIMVDYNQSLTPAEAIDRARALDDEGVSWIEEPTLAEDYGGHARVAREARTAIQAGENWWGPHDFARAIDAGACDLVMPDVMKVGGVTGWMRTAALADAHGIRTSNHLFVEISTELLCATPTAHWLEYAQWFEPVIAQPLRVEDGNAVPSERPGSGIEWNEDAVSRYLVA